VILRADAPAVRARPRSGRERRGEERASQRGQLQRTAENVAVAASAPLPRSMVAVQTPSCKDVGPRSGARAAPIAVAVPRWKWMAR
jgi:hypothetical protein